MGRQDLALLHFTKYLTEAFVTRAFVSVAQGSASSEQVVVPGDPSHPAARRPCTARTCACGPRVWVPLPCLEGPALDGRGN